MISRIEGLAQDPRPSGSRKLQGEQNLWRIRIGDYRVVYSVSDLEQRLAQLGRKLSAEDASSLIAEDFIEFGASGRVWSKAEIIAAMSEWAPVERIIEDFKVRELSASVCVVTYKSFGGSKPNYSLRSSIWRCAGEKWQIVFHQGTGVRWKAGGGSNRMDTERDGL